MRSYCVVGVHVRIDPSMHSTPGRGGLEETRSSPVILSHSGGLAAAKEAASSRARPVPQHTSSQLTGAPLERARADSHSNGSMWRSRAYPLLPRSERSRFMALLATMASDSSVASSTNATMVYQSAQRPDDEARLQLRGEERRL